MTRQLSGRPSSQARAYSVMARRGFLGKPSPGARTVYCLRKQPRTALSTHRPAPTTIGWRFREMGQRFSETTSKLEPTLGDDESCPSVVDWFGLAHRVVSEVVPKVPVPSAAPTKAAAGNRDGGVRGAAHDGGDRLDGRGRRSGSTVGPYVSVADSRLSCPHSLSHWSG